MIDIIIPAYNSHNTISNTLNTIAYQTIIDKIRVYIVNDASAKDYTSEVDYFSNFMSIKEIKLTENSGPGVARREGLKVSRSKYVMFIDSDDVFASPIAVETLYNKIDKDNYDLVIGNFAEQSISGELKTHKEDKTWLHGKIYRRSFLKNNHLTFNESRANEDNAFNRAILLRNPKYTCIDELIYYWLYNSNSITRVNSHCYSYEGLFGYIENMTWVLEDAIKDNVDSDKISYLAISVLYAMYYYYLHYEKEELATSCQKLLEITNKFPVKDLKKKEELIHDQFLTSLENLDYYKLNNPSITIEEFIAMIGGNKND